MVNINRYAELLEEQPRGSFWDPTGVVLPFRDTAYDFLFETGQASKEFTIFVNKVQRGPVTTDTNGDAVVSIILDVGQADIELIGDPVGDTFKAFITIRDSATWLAAYADVFESIDASTEDVREGVHLETSSSRFLEDVFGRLVRQPNDLGGYLTNTYRRVVQEMRQGFRFWGGRQAGLRQIVNAFTDVNPLQIPRTWRPTWFLGTQLADNADFQTHARETSTDLNIIVDDIASPGLNVRSLNFVHAGFAGDDPAFAFPGPIANPPNGAETLIVAMASGYDGEDVTIIGVDQNAQPVQEIFSAGVYPVIADTVIQGTFLFATVTSITKAVVGGAAATASVGLGTSRFITILDIGDHSPPVTGAATFELRFDSASNRLSWGSPSAFTDGAVLIPDDGTYIIGDDLGALALFTGLNTSPDLTPTASYDTAVTVGAFSGDNDRLYIQVDDLGIVPVELPVGNLTLQQVIDAINDSFRREPPYGAVKPAMRLRIVGSPVDGDIITLDDGVLSQVFEFDDDDVLGAASRIPVDISLTSGLDPEPIQAGNLVTRMTTQLSLSGILINGSKDNSSDENLRQNIGTGTGGSADVFSDTLVIPDVEAKINVQTLDLPDRAVLTSGAGTTMILTDPLAAGAQGFDSSDLGRGIEFALLTNAVNNGTFTITRVVNAQQIEFTNGGTGIPEIFAFTPRWRIRKTATEIFTIGGTAPNMTITAPGALSTAAFNFRDVEVGCSIEITGAPTAANDGRFIITARTGLDTFTYTNGIGVAEAVTPAATWSVKKHIMIAGVTARNPGTTSSTIFGSGVAEGTDDGQGAMIPVSGSGNTITGTINYVTGAITVDENGTNTWDASEEVDIDFVCTCDGDILLLSHAFGGGQSDITFTDGTGGDITAEPSGAETGTDSPNYAAVASGKAGTTGFAPHLASPLGGGLVLDESAIQLHRGGADNNNVVFGNPKAVTTLSALEPAGETSIACVSTDEFPVPAVNIIIEGFFDGSFTTGAPTNQPTRATALEVVFGPFWDGGLIRVTGTDCNGNIVSESFVPPTSPLIVDSGTAAEGKGVSDPSSGGRLDILSPATTFLFSTNIKPGMLFEVLTGAAAAVRPVKFFGNAGADPSTSRVLLRSVLPAAASDEDWRVLTTQTVKGSTLFKTVTLVENLTLGTSVDAARVQVLDGPETYGFDVIIGRGLRASGDDGYVEWRLTSAGDPGVLLAPFGEPSDGTIGGADPNMTLTALGASGADSGVAGPFTASMVGKPITIASATTPSNNGTFVVASFSSPTLIGYTTTGGGVAEAFGAGTTWDIGGQYAASVRDIQGYMKISGGSEYTGNNNGLHKIFVIDPLVEGLTFAFLRHEKINYIQRFVPGDYISGVGGPSFNPEPNLDWEVYSIGEVHRVLANDTGTDTLTIEGMSPTVGSNHGGLNDPITLGEQVEVERDLPFERRAPELGLGQITVEVDTALAPTTTPVLESIAIDSGDDTGIGGSIPDGWQATNVDHAATLMVYPSEFNPLRWALTSSGAADMTIFRDVSRVPADYKGFTIRVAFWVQWHGSDATQDFRVDVSFDDASSFTLGTPVTVPLTHGDASDGQAIDSTQIVETIEVPFDATTCIIRLFLPGVVGAGRVWSVERASVVATFATAQFLAENTVIREANRSEFGEILYIWSPEDLQATENSALGIPTFPASTPVEIGHIDNVVNAHGFWERFDISEYDPTGLPLNVRGIYNETDWATVTFTNMAITIGTPPRLTFAAPTLPSLVEGEELTVTAPSNALLLLTSVHEGSFPEESGDDDILFEDAGSGLVPVPATPKTGSIILPWRFLSATSIQIASVPAGDPAGDAVFNPAAAYTIDYELLIRAESPVIDLDLNSVTPGDWADFLWLVDAKIFRRAETDIVTRQVEQLLTFRTDFRAELLQPSDQDQAATVLVQDTGLVKTIIPQANWRYESATIIALDASVFDANSIFTLTYNGLAGTQRRQANFTIEIRSATTDPGVAGDTYRTAQLDEVVDRTHQFHQMRVSFQDVLDVRDLRLGSMGFKGIRLYGSPAFAPGIIQCDD